ncbi:MAG: hypothetical protein ACK55Z_01330, partial [bacterium]
LIPSCIKASDTHAVRLSTQHITTVSVYLWSIFPRKLLLIDNPLHDSTKLRGKSERFSVYEMVEWVLTYKSNDSKRC